MRAPNLFFSLLPCAFVMAAPLTAQHLRVGVIAGTALTSDYTTTTLPPTILTGRIVPGNTFKSDGRSVSGGPTIGWDFNDTFSFETGAMYRRLRLEGIGPTVTWEVPLLAKYRVPTGTNKLRPFLDLGPSLRLTGNKNTLPSHVGITGGAGLDFQLGSFRLSPTLRYTRWAADSEVPRAPSRPDQIELLFQLTHGGGGDGKPLGIHWRVGVAGGFTLVTPGAASVTSGVSRYTSGGVETDAISYSRSGIAGVRLEFDLASHVSLLAEVNYRQANSLTKVTNTVIPGIIPVHDKSIFWQAPVLLRYGFRSSTASSSLQPFVDLGASFRLPQRIGVNTSHYGMTGATGVRIPHGRLHYEAGLRYTYWGPSTYISGGIAPNWIRRNRLDPMFAVVF